MGKIAVLLNDACSERERLGAEPGLRARLLAAGDDWAVEDVLCTHRPSDASFEERHGRYRVALVGAGTFDCRGARGRELLTPGSLLLGNVDECFECGHDARHRRSLPRVRVLAADRSSGSRSTPACAASRGCARCACRRSRALAPLVAEACAAWVERRLDDDAWDELGVRLAAAAVRFAGEPKRAPRSPANAERGVARAVRLIERDPRATLALDVLAREAKLSRFHFVRAFARVTGLTPHRYVLRARLRKAAVRLATDDARVVDVAMTSGFRDVSNFNHAFRAEFGTTPRAASREAAPPDAPGRA